MITPADVMKVLTDVCPTLTPRWEAIDREWGDPDERPVHLGVVAFASHIVELADRGEGAELERIFCALEHLHLEADREVQILLMCNLFDVLRNPPEYKAGNPDVLLPYLGTQSLYYWEELGKVYTEHGQVVAETLKKVQDSMDSLVKYINARRITDTVDS